MRKLTTDDFIAKAKLIYKDKYDYSKVDYKGNKTKIIIICQKHGEFLQTPDAHLCGKGCKRCATASTKLKRHSTTETFIVKAKSIHGEKYDYSKVNYINSKTPVIIICPEHGEFEQEPNSHLQGRGCKHCSSELVKQKSRSTTEEFIIKARLIHGDKYDYSKVNYINNNTKITIICPIHGEFEQVPSSHLQGVGCPNCNATKWSTELFIKESNIIHNNKYDYSKVNYINKHKHVTIICPEHGEFEQEPNSHLQGKGCWKCGVEKRIDAKRGSTESFILAAKSVYGDLYDYSKVVYSSTHEPVTIICPEHGEFEKSPANHISNKQGCPKCSDCGPSAPEKEIEVLLQENNINYISNDRKQLNGFELDFYLPDLKIAIEFNGSYWHCDEFKQSTYHQNKSKACKEKGIQLIHIWENNWNKNKDLCKSIILAKLGKLKIKHFARKLKVKTVSHNDAKLFLQNNHLQGYTNSAIKLGLYANDILIALMTFGTPRYDKTANIELLRYAVLQNNYVIGGASKLFQHYIRNYCSTGQSIISYANFDISNGKMYEELGFKYVAITEPNYIWFKTINQSYPRYQTQKHKLADLLGTEFDPLLSESENMRKAGYFKLYDSGNLKYIYTVQ